MNYILNETICQIIMALSCSKSSCRDISSSLYYWQYFYIAEIMNQTIGVYIGRCNPLHLGHEAVIDRMIAEHGDRCLFILWSSNVILSAHDPFLYSERESFAKILYPDLCIAPLPDYPTDAERLQKLDEIIQIYFPDISKEHIVFRAGAEEEVSRLVDDGRQIRIVDRFSWETPIVSATQVREALVRGESISGMVNELLLEKINELYASKGDLL